MLLNDLKLSVVKVAGVKIALNAQKARAAAKSVGLIPDYRSDWKWALRQMRAPSMNAIDGEIVLSGRDLANAKAQKIGLLPNNAFQKLRAASRAHGSHSKEVAYKDGNIFLGDANRVNVPSTSSQQSAHTHPSSSIISDYQEYRSGKLSKNVMAEYARMFDKVLSASPSGAMANKDTIPDIIRTIDKVKGQSSDILTDNRENRTAGKKALREIRRRFVKEFFGKYSPVTTKKLPTSDLELAELLFGVKALPRGIGDITAMANASVRPGGGSIKENIVSNHTTGVHKYRPDHDRFSRSVYFDKGLLT